MNKKEAIKKLKECSWEYERSDFFFKRVVGFGDAKKIISQIGGGLQGENNDKR